MYTTSPMPSALPAITADELDALAAQFAPKVRRATHGVIGEVLEWGPLTEDHVRLAEEAKVSPLNTPAPRVTSIARLRTTHHRLAQLIAVNTPFSTAARLCGMAPNTVSNYMQDPAFNELVAHFRCVKDEAWADFVQQASDLSLDFLQHIREMLDETPEKFTPSVALEALKTIGDRAGHAPITRNVNVSVNLDVATRMRNAQARLRERAVIDGETTVVEG